MRTLRKGEVKVSFTVKPDGTVGEGRGAGQRTTRA
jgi:outer membrane biosynthesis protein TonB